MDKREPRQAFERRVLALLPADVQAEAQVVLREANSLSKSERQKGMAAPRALARERGFEI